MSENHRHTVNILITIQGLKVSCHVNMGILISGLKVLVGCNK